MSTYGDMPEHIESFKEWIDEGLIERNSKLLWSPPLRSMVTGHRVSINDSFRPIETRHLNWRWWLAEIPNRILARYMARMTEDREMRGEEWIGHHVNDDD